MPLYLLIRTKNSIRFSLPHIDLGYEGLRDRSLFMCGGGGGGKSWGGPGLFNLEKRGGPKENFTMIGGGSLCVL